MSASASIPLAERLLNAPVAVMIYLRDTLRPIDLAPYHPFELGGVDLLRSACALGVALLTWLAWKQSDRRPYVLVGWLWFLGMLVPVIGIVQVGGQAYADRYTYLPSIGLFLAAAFGAREWMSQCPNLRVPLILLGTIAVSACVFLSRAQTARWRDSRTLATHTLAVTGDDNAFAHQILAKAVFDQDPATALVHLARALEIVPNLPGAHGSLGILFAKEGRFVEAAAEFRADIAVEERANAYKNLGLALAYCGQAANALAAYERALELDDTDVATLLEVAWTRATSRDASLRDGVKARRFAERARVVAGTENASISSTLGAADAECGDFASAQSSANKAARLADASGQKALAERARAQIEAYSRGVVYRP